MVTEHDLEMSFKDGYEVGYEEGMEAGVNISESRHAETTFVLAIVSLVFGIVIGIALCKFVPGFWEWTSKGLFR